MMGRAFGDIRAPANFGQAQACLGGVEQVQDSDRL